MAYENLYFRTPEFSGGAGGIRHHLPGAGSEDLGQDLETMPKPGSTPLRKVPATWLIQMIIPNSTLRKDCEIGENPLNRIHPRSSHNEKIDRLKQKLLAPQLTVLCVLCLHEPSIVSLVRSELSIS